jgi:hypothetical protein
LLNLSDFEEVKQKEEERGEGRRRKTITKHLYERGRENYIIEVVPLRNKNKAKEKARGRDDEEKQKRKKGLADGGRRKKIGK